MQVEPDIRRSRGQVGLLRIGLCLLVGTVGYMVPISAVTAVLLPARLAELAPQDKVALLAAATAASAAVGLVTNVVFGALSDATRSRFGRRTPYIVGGAVGSALGMIPLSQATGVTGLILWWCLSATALNAMVAGMLAILPDRVPVARRATHSAVMGVGVLLGTAVGTILGSAFLGDDRTGLLVVGAVTVVLAVSAVLLAPEPVDTTGGATGGTAPGPAGAAPTGPQPFRLSRVAASFRFPRGAPDFYWALWARLLLVLGYYMVNGFQLYIFTDHVGLDQAETARMLGLNSILFLLTALVGAVVAGPLSDRSGRRKVFVVTASLIAVVAVALPLLIPTTAGMLAFGVVGGAAFGVYYAVDAALMSEVLPNPESRARDMGILHMATTGGQVLAPAASSVLIGVGVGFAPVFLGAAAACLVAAVLIPPIRSVR